MSPTTILQINKFHYIRGGAERYYFALSKLLEEEGHRVVHFSMSDKRNAMSPYAEHFVSRTDFSKPRASLSGLKTMSRMFWSFESARKLERLIQKTKPALAHLHNIYHQLSPSILPVLKRHKIPVVMTLHDYKLISPNYKFLCGNAICEHRGAHWKDILHRSVKDSYPASALCAAEMLLHQKLYERYVDHFLVASEFMKKKFVEYGWDGQKISVLPYTIDVNAYMPQPSKTPSYFLYVGRLSKEKGMNVLLEAMSKLPPTVSLKIVGQGPEEQNQRLQVAGYRLPNVEFVGFKDGQELQDIIAKSFCVVVPSIWYEVFGIVIAEAMALGKPVIASRVGGIPEVVTDTKTGLLVPMNDADALQHAMEYLLEHPDRAYEMGTAARRDVQRFDTHEHYKEISAIYEQAIGQ